MGCKWGKNRSKKQKHGDKPLSPPAGLEAGLSAFLAWVQLERGLSANTTESYESDLVQCACFFHSEGVKQWSDVSLEHVSGWISSLTIEGYAVASLSRKLSSLRMLARFLLAEGKLKSDFTELLINPKKGTYLPHTLSIDEMEKFLNAPDLTTPQGKRDRAIFELMYGSGLRVSEISTVLVNSVDLDDGFARILEKVQKKELCL